MAGSGIGSKVAVKLPTLLEARGSLIPRNSDPGPGAENAVGPEPTKNNALDGIPTDTRSSSLAMKLGLATIEAGTKAPMSAPPCGASAGRVPPLSTMASSSGKYPPPSKVARSTGAPPSGGILSNTPGSRLIRPVAVMNIGPAEVKSNACMRSRSGPVEGAEVWPNMPLARASTCTTMGSAVDTTGKPRRLTTTSAHNDQGEMLGPRIIERLLERTASGVSTLARARGGPQDISVSALRPVGRELWNIYWMVTITSRPLRLRSGATAHQRPAPRCPRRDGRTTRAREAVGHKAAAAPRVAPPPPRLTQLAAACR